MFSKEIQKRSLQLAALLSLAVSTTCAVNAQLPKHQAEAQAELDKAVLIAVATASKNWKDAFNAGDAEAAAAMYEEHAVMVVKPFGIFKGRDEIQAFWNDIVSKGFDDVVYTHTVTTIIDESSARIESNWTMNNAYGQITNELWVIQEDGRALLREDHFEISP